MIYIYYTQKNTDIIYTYKLKEFTLKSQVDFLGHLRPKICCLRCFCFSFWLPICGTMYILPATAFNTFWMMNIRFLAPIVDDSELFFESVWYGKTLTCRLLGSSTMPGGIVFVNHQQYDLLFAHWTNGNVVVWILEVPLMKGILTQGAKPYLKREMYTR